MLTVLLSTAVGWVGVDVLKYCNANAKITRTRGLSPLWYFFDYSSLLLFGVIAAVALKAVP